MRAFAVLAALGAGWTLPAGTGLALAVLGAAAVVLGLHAAAAHERGLTRLRAAR